MGYEETAKKREETLSDGELKERVMGCLREHGPSTTDEIYRAVWGEDPEAPLR